MQFQLFESSLTLGTESQENILNSYPALHAGQTVSRSLASAALKLEFRGEPTSPQEPLPITVCLAGQH